jgi:hypothetical protein
MMCTPIFHAMKVGDEAAGELGEQGVGDPRQVVQQLKLLQQLADP